MSEIYQRYLPPDPHGVRAAAPTQIWRTALSFASNARVRFIALVAGPTVIATLYFGLIASPQYVSTTEYIVRGVDAHRSSGLSALLNTFGVSRAADETSAIESFLKSREVIDKVNARVDLHAVFGSKKADWLSRFPRFWERDSFENLYEYIRSYLTITKDSASGVTRLEIATYDPQSSQAIAKAMLDLAGEMANSLNARAEADMVDTSKRELVEARDDVVKLQTELTAFRNKSLLVDPLAFAGAMLQEIGALTLERSKAQTQISEAERLSPNNPSIESLKATASALDHKVEEERAKLAGDDSSLSGKVASYERLTLLRDLAEKRYASALVSLQTAESDAQRKRVYIEEIDKPNLPDEPMRPERLRSILSVFVIGFMAFSILWILSVGSKDHAQ